MIVNDVKVEQKKYSCKRFLGSLRSHTLLTDGIPESYNSFRSPFGIKKLI